MNKLALMAGVDIPIPELQLTLHQPSIKEIALIGELDYFSTVQTICFDKKTIIAANVQGSSSLAVMNNFQIFMTLINMPMKDAGTSLQDKIIAVFALFFPGYETQLLPNGLGLYLNNVETKHSLMINDTNFDLLQSVLTEATAVRNSTGGQNANFNPKGKKAAAIAAKIMKGRAKAAQGKGYSADGMLGRYVSVIAIGLGLSLTDCLNLTVYQLYDLIERYGLYVGWDLDIRSRLAGGTPDSKPDDWMKDLH